MTGAWCSRATAAVFLADNYGFLRGAGDAYLRSDDHGNAMKFSRLSKQILPYMRR